jgi:hypothetical protein
MDIILLIAGIVLFFKKEVKISRKRQLTGRPVKVLALLYILPFVSAFLVGFVSRSAEVNIYNIAFTVSSGLIILAVLVTLYFIFSKKYSPTIA